MTPVDDKDPIWDWIVGIVLLAFLGLFFIGYLICKSFNV